MGINHEEVIEKARNAISGYYENFEKVLCNICWEEKLPKFIQKNPCGSDNCKNPVCDTCLADWYKQAKPGKRVDSSWVCCPFCKTRPKYKVLSQTGADLKKAFLPKTWTNDVYGWCLDCDQILVERTHECAILEPPEFDDFRCGCKDVERELQMLSLQDFEDEIDDFDEWARNQHVSFQQKKTWEIQDSKFRNAKGQAGFEKALRTAQHFNLFDKDYKLCSACGMGVQKRSGCDHMTCYCGCHWCWACGLGHFKKGSHTLCLRNDIGAEVNRGYALIYDHWNLGECAGTYLYNQ